MSNDSLRDGVKGKRIYLRTLLYIVIMVFFLIVVFLFYKRLDSETRENIVNESRINAIESSQEIDRRMSSSLDILKLSAYTLDNMIVEKRSQEEILDFLIDETVAVGNSLIEETTGVYGYINGEYMDGSGWVPDEGYDPTIRPWYVEGRAGNGEIVIVDPYVDLDTGSVMIALTKTLCDKESVVGIDINMDGLQSVLEENVSDNLNYEFIVNSKGIIVAHSVKEYIGEDIFVDDDPFATEIADHIKKSETDDFYFGYNNRDYIVYVMPLEYGWTCVSVIDATDEFAALKGPLYFTAVISVVIVIIFIIIMIMAEKRDRKAKEFADKSRKAESASEAKSSFLSNMSHEIRTPVNAILGMNEMILRECGDEAVIEYSENIKSAGNSLLGLINDILDFSKIEAGKIEIIPVDYDLSSVINDLVNMIHTRAVNKGLELKLDIDRNIPKCLHGDEVRIKQIITNILTNAVKYTEEGSVTFSMGYEDVPGSEDEMLLKVKITDTGIGIKEDDLKKLFSKFERIDEERIHNIEGTGLGMNITKSLLDIMGSSLNVESKYGKGSCFSFELIQKVVSREPLGDYEEAFRQHLKNQSKYREKFTADTARILVVDDNPMNLVVFKNLVKQTLVCVDTANDGNEAIVLASENSYDILFLDHLMPGKDGIETLHDIKENASGPNINTPAVCLTANAVSGAREIYMEAGFDDYLTKPIDTAQLEEMMLRLLPEEKVKTVTEESGTLETAGISQASAGKDDIPEKLRPLLECDQIDVKAGLKNNATTALYIEILNIYYDSYEDVSEELNRLLSDEDFKNYTIKIHALKSSSKIIGANKLGDLAQKLEDAGKSGTFDYIRENHEKFMSGYSRLVKKIGDIRGELNKEDKPLADPGFILTKYEEIFHAADDMDCERLENIFKELDEYCIPDGETVMMKKLRDATSAFDYDLIVELLPFDKD